MTNAKTQSTIHAAPEKVWSAITTPEVIKQFMMGADTHTTWEVGSPIRWTGEYKGKTYEDKGVVKKFDPPNVLETTYWSSMQGKPDAPENYVTVTWELSAKDGATVLTITQTTSEEGVDHAKQQWSGVLASIKKIVEAQ